MKHFSDQLWGVPRIVALVVALSFTGSTTNEVLASALNPSADDLNEIQSKGQKIYRAQCASCHGQSGEGVESEYADALVGDSTVGELTDLISDTMPEEDPDLCVAEDANAVAEYIHFAFYSEAARIRNRPPRIELTRLTANQLRQSLADLYAHFGSLPKSADVGGLQGSYFEGDRWKEEKRKIQRLDPVIDFDFGHDGPGEEIDPKEFYINWSGALCVPESGVYEIVVRSTCSFIMDFGHRNRRLIDNHVQSGDKTEFRRTLYLIAGRVYPLKIDMRQRKRKTEQPPASFSLSWKPPHGVEQVIPSRFLCGSNAPATFSIQTPLPPDDRSYGYERGIAVSRQWDDATTAAAIEFANVAIEELWPEYRRRHRQDADENRAQLRAFLSELCSVAFRGQMDDRLRQVYIDKQVDASPDDKEAIKRVVLLTLKSPRFLYPLADENQPRAQRVANRLTLTLLDSLPAESWLLKQIEKGQFKNQQQVRAMAERLVSDERVVAKTREFVQAWLNLEHIGEITKDESQYAGFDERLVSDLRASLDAFVDDVLRSESADYRQFFTADWSYSTPRIGEFYGDAWHPVDSSEYEVTKTGHDANARLGLLNHPYLMSGLAYHDSTSPIHRGVFLNRYLLGRTIRPPNEAFTPLAVDLHPELTTRQRVEKQTSPDSCQACHIKINGLGFTLEHFDAVGRFRSEEREQPVNASGSYTSLADKPVAIDGASELSSYLASSPDAHRAFVSRAFQHFVKQPPAAYGPETLDQLTQQFVESGYNIRQLVVEIAVIAATENNAIFEQDS